MRISTACPSRHSTPVWRNIWMQWCHHIHLEFQKNMPDSGRVWNNMYGPIMMFLNAASVYSSTTICRYYERHVNLVLHRLWPLPSLIPRGRCVISANLLQ